jgi:hypothetical protein
MTGLLTYEMSLQCEYIFDRWAELLRTLLLYILTASHGPIGCHSSALASQLPSHWLDLKREMLVMLSTESALSLVLLFLLQ